MRAHYEAVFKRSGFKPEPLVAAEEELPLDVAYLWDWYDEIAHSRPVGLSGAARIPYSEILAWSLLTGRWPRPWEVDALMKMDEAFVVATSKNVKGNSDGRR